ncbi:MAG: VWA domain-containing protein [Myxococcota bacterium]|nr:VWA domain-containing protein [Myxococcota bacterium]
MILWVGCGASSGPSGESPGSDGGVLGDVVFGSTGPVADTSTPPPSPPSAAPDVVAWFPDAQDAEYGWARPSDGGSEPETAALPTCGDETVVVPPPSEPASVLLALDRSGSMSSNGKWEMAVGALGDVLDVVGPSINFGLLLYPQQAYTCTLTPEMHVPFGLSQGPHIVDTMTTLGTSHGTPTGGALAAALGIFEAHAPTETRVLIITTDGQPNCPHDCTGCEATADGGCSGGDCDSCSQDSKCVRLKVLGGVQALAAAGVTTYVIGLPGSEGATDLLDEMAVLGGTALEGPVKHYDIASGGSLGETLLAITDSLGNCSVPLEPPPGYAFLTVQIDGVAIPQDPEGVEGWSLVDGASLHFYGDACVAASAEDAEVSVTYVCKYVE